MMKRNILLLMVIVIAACMLLPFLLPFFLAIVFSLIKLAVPIGIAMLILKVMTNNQVNKQSRVPRRKVNHSKISPKQNTGSVQNPNPVISESEDETVGLWYETNGHQRIGQLIAQLKREGKSQLWIRKDGICTTNNGENQYKRIGSLRDYPGQHADTIALKIMNDRGIQASVRGKYLYLSWKENI